MSGSQLEARYDPPKFLQTGHGRVRLTTEDGRSFAVPVNSLSEGDQAYLQSLAPKKPVDSKSEAIPSETKLRMSEFDKQWTIMENCRLKKDESNDGDSFHVLNEAKEEFLFRLYMVDTPETKMDSQLEDRIFDQAEKFVVSVDEVLKQGEKATKFTEKVLKKPFTVITRFQKALGRSNMQRYYAFIVTDDGQDLTRLLIYEGWGRAYGRPVKTGVQPASALTEKLEDMEKSARKNKRGIWAKSKI